MLRCCQIGGCPSFRAIPELLTLLDIKGCLVSIDAMGCQTHIAKTIVEQQGDYLLAVKGNQPTLFDAVRKALAPQLTDPLNQEGVAIEQQHGRIEVREYHVLDAGALASQFPDWPGLQTIGVAVSYRAENKKKTSLEMRYFISSKKLGRDAFAQAVRGHLALENSLHWVLDVTMGEDACPIYRGDAAEILACIRHMALNMLRAETTRKASIRRKQKIAGMSSEYLEAVLAADIQKLTVS